MRVIETAKDAMSARITLVPMELTKSPTLPGSSMIGRNASTVVKVDAACNDLAAFADAAPEAQLDAP